MVWNESNQELQSSYLSHEKAVSSQFSSIIVTYLGQDLYGVGKWLGMQKVIVEMKVLHPFEALQISICLTRMNAIAYSELTDESDGISYSVSFFTCHFFLVFAFFQVCCKYSEKSD